MQVFPDCLLKSTCYGVPFKKIADNSKFVVLLKYLGKHLAEKALKGDLTLSREALGGLLDQNTLNKKPNTALKDTYLFRASEGEIWS